MRGPSSSHTAGSYHIGVTVRHLLGTEPSKVRIYFDQNGSYARTYKQQGVDLAFCTGLMGWELTDELFKRALAEASELKVSFTFEISFLKRADHPNFVVIEIEDTSAQLLVVEAKSTGGGTFELTRINGSRVHLNGKSYETLITVDNHASETCVERLRSAHADIGIQRTHHNEKEDLIQLSSSNKLPEPLLDELGPITKQSAEPVYFTQKGRALFESAEEMTAFSQQNKCSLGEAVLRYEMTILGLSEEEAIEQMLYRYSVMKQSVIEGLQDDTVNMFLLDATAASIMERVEKRQVAIGGIHAEASAAALAAMHTCNSQGVVCAAPTGGAAGTIPGVITTLEKHYSLSKRKRALILFAAGGVGIIIANRATFAAEVAGCQVEIGAAGAMASAAVVEFSGGTARQACDAAAISFQNTMGLVCDLVQGMCELPCHTRNGIAASSAFTNADMILGGYVNPVGLDETIDAVYSSGKMMPQELRCTARGGLAIAPSAQALVSKR